MSKKLLRKISVLSDTVKGILITVVVFSLIAIFSCIIIHNILKIGEISTKYSGDYKNLVPITENKMMNVYVEGEGDSTIVILSEFASESPIVQYKAIVERLKNNYKVVVIEYFGYGFSMSANEERINKNIALEIKTALASSGIEGQYILMPHGISNIYAMYYADVYPEDIKGIISIDGLYPNELSETYLSSKIDDMEKNVTLTSIAEVTGFSRVLSYVKPEDFYINVMQSDSVYTYEDISVYRNRIGSNYLNSTMVKEIKKLKENMEELKNYKYSEYLPVLQILSTDKINEYNSYKLNGDTKKDLEDFANEFITNSEIQMIVEIEGDHMLQLTNPEDIALSVNMFINSYL